LLSGSLLSADSSGWVLRDAELFSLRLEDFFVRVIFVVVLVEAAVSSLDASSVGVAPFYESAIGVAGVELDESAILPAS
jgi:hypothetical protein